MRSAATSGRAVAACAFSVLAGCSPGLVKYETPEAKELPAAERAVILGYSFYVLIGAGALAIYAVDGRPVDTGWLHASRVEVVPGPHVIEITYGDQFALTPIGGPSMTQLSEFAADFRAGHVYRANLCVNYLTTLLVTAPDGTTRTETIPCRDHEMQWRLSQRARQTCPEAATAYWRDIPLAPWEEDSRARQADVPAGECQAWFYSERGLFSQQAPLLEARVQPSEGGPSAAPEYAVQGQFYAHWRLAPGDYVLTVRDVSAGSEQRWPFQCTSGSAILVADAGREQTGVFNQHTGWTPLRFERVDTLTGLAALLDRFLSAGLPTTATDKPFSLKCVRRVEAASN